MVTMNYVPKKTRHFLGTLLLSDISPIVGIWIHPYSVDRYALASLKQLYRLVLLAYFPTLA